MASTNAMIDRIDRTRCLVTGAAGYLGSHLVAALVERDCEVHALDVQAPTGITDRVRWFQGDIRNRNDLERACDGIELVFHTAALIEAFTHAPRSFADRVREVNVGGTRKLLEAAQRAGVRRFVYTSSIVTALGVGGATGLDETAPYSGAKDLYTSTKIEAERLVLEANRTSGVLTCALRPGGIYGPGERVPHGRLIRMLKKGAPVVVFGDGTARLDHVYIDNLVDGQLKAAERLVDGSPVCGQAYFLSDDAPINAGELAIVLAREMGIDRRPLRVPAGLGRALGLVGERWFQLFGGPKPAFTMANIDLIVADHYFSIEKAKSHLDYSPSIDPREGLRRMGVEARAYYDSL